MKYGIEYFKYNICTIICFLTVGVVSAQSISTKKSDYFHITLGEKDGYNIDQLSSMVFDDDGWLWLSGVSTESRNYKLDNRNLIIQRFNGEAFYNVEIPDLVLEGTTDLVLHKASNNSFYVKLESQSTAKLFKLDAGSLLFSEIKLPDLDNNSIYEIWNIQDKFLFIQQDPNGNLMYYLNQDDTFTPVGKMNTNEYISKARILELGEDLLISKFNFKPELFTKVDGRLQSKTLDSNSPFYKDNAMQGHFHKESSAYMTFPNDPIIYRYNNQSGELVDSNLFSGEDVFVEQTMFQDRKENILFRQFDNKRTQLQIISSLEEGSIWLHRFDNDVIKGHVFASRDLTKEVVLDNHNVLEIFCFDTDDVGTFLHDFSIRSMVQLDSDKVLVATDFDGWYILDLKKLKVSEYSPIINQLKISPRQNRDISFVDNILWSNDKANLIMVDYKTGIARKFRTNDNLAAMNQNEENIVYADVGGTLQTFNKETYQFNTLVENDSLKYENLILKENSTYAATSQGLKHIKNLSTVLYQPTQNTADNYLVSMLEYGDNQLLLGSRSGKLFAFDIVTQSFQELYEDEFSASIASILVDDKERIWLNTFAGIVVFYPDTKKTIRIGVKDGLSHFEANRFSTLKLENGNFLVGTVKGLNYFHPDSLITSFNKDKYNHLLQMVRIEKYDTDENQVKTIVNRTELDSIKTLTLPARSKNLVLDFGVLKPRLNIDYLYRYRLDNADWIDIGNKHEIRLLNMQSGSYNLEIQALNKTRNKVLASLSYGLVVKQFFYESVWFYIGLVVMMLLAFLVYTFKWREVNLANYKNQLLQTEIEYKKKDLTDFATNISRNQQWNDYLISKMIEIKEAKGRKKGAAIVNLEKEIKEKKNVLESNFEFQKRIDVLNNEFYDSLLKRYPDLSKTEIKLCSLIRLNLDNYDIATLQNVDISSVYKSRYRLRKKLNMASDTDLDAFLRAF
ncbi:hypothetical protein [Winogradskyella sp. 3972H.M.0a.05]|uniref:hypothetical protein n=1 Tax=Winogradskyella sp. 3972H.M.0a.05 TaxID=2950277 RepID=UPI0033911B1E